MSVGQNIRRLRQQADLGTQQAMARRLGVPGSQLSDWENDRYSTFQVSTLLNLAKVFRCSVDELLAGVDPDYDRVLGLIPTVAEGDPAPIGSPNDRGQGRTVISGWAMRPGDLHDPDAYGVRVLGDSMVPVHRPNTLQIVSPRLAVQAGDEGYVQLASGERLVRLVHPAPAGYVLQPYNHTYSPRLVEREEVRAIHVIAYSCRCSGEPDLMPDNSRGRPAAEPAQGGDPMNVYAGTNWRHRTRYHRDLLCHVIDTLRARGTEVEQLTVEQARERGYRPCRLCRPPQ